MNKPKQYFKVLSCGTFEELIEQLNFFISNGWFVEELDENRTEFFQEHTALLVNESYMRKKKEYLDFFESKNKEFNLLLKKSKFNGGVTNEI